MIKFELFSENKHRKLADGFFEGWPNPPDKKTHLKILKNSFKSIVAVENDEVIGFITAISDGVISAYVPLLEVIPKKRHQGIGKKLVEKMFYELKDLYMVDLICDENLVDFYKGFDMYQYNSMIKRNYDSQSAKNI